MTALLGPPASPPVCCALLGLLQHLRLSSTLRFFSDYQRTVIDRQTIAWIEAVRQPARQTTDRGENHMHADVNCSSVAWRGLSHSFPYLMQVGSNDTAVVARLMEEVAHADIDSESVFNLTEGNLIKIFQLSQLMLQYANHERRVLEYQYDEFLENRELVLQLLERAGVRSLKDLRDGTDQLGHQFQGLAGRELDDMFGQVGASCSPSTPVAHRHDPSALGVADICGSLCVNVCPTVAG